MKVEKLELLTPAMCFSPNNHKGQDCNVLKRGYYERIHCFDLDFPFYLQYPKYSCHQNRFSALNPTIINAIPVSMDLNIELVVMGRNIIVLLRFTFIIYLDTEISTLYNNTIFRIVELF
jgi:hypothetical protein